MVKSKNLTWHDGQVSRSSREELLGQKGVTIWLTGLSGSGKSTIAVAAEAKLRARFPGLQACTAPFKVHSKIRDLRERRERDWSASSAG